MAESGEVVTYGTYEARCNKLAHLLRARGLQRLDHYAVFMENNVRYMECCGAGERAGHYYTCINSYLTAEEVAGPTRENRMISFPYTRAWECSPGGLPTNDKNT